MPEPMQETAQLDPELFARLVAEVSDYAIFLLDPRGIIRSWNAGAQNIKGYSSEEIIGQHFSRFYLPDALAKRWPEEELLRASSGRRFEDEGWRVRKDGSTFWANVVITALRSAEGELQGFLKITRDLTERKRAEEQARELLQQTAGREAIEARLRLAAIVESSTDAIIGQSLDGQIISWNKGAERLYGYSETEVIGEPISIIVPLDHSDEVPHLLDRIRSGERIEHFETERLRRDGSRVDVSLTLSPIRNALGEIIGVSKIARDISARKLEDRKKNEFLAMLAHELRNPLAAVRNSLHVLSLSEHAEEGVADPIRPAATEVHKMMDRQLDHLVRLVDDLLDVSRVSRGRLELRKDFLELSDVVRHALDTCTPQVQKYNHKLIVELPEAPLWLHGDRTRLAQAICNLVSNSAKYSSPGSEIRLIAGRDENQGVIRVSDTGIGIRAEMLSGIFELFTQIDQSLEKSQSGLGVGLYIVKVLVELHGGTVEAQSPGLGEGSEFIVRLPLVEGNALRVPAAAPHSASKAASEKRRVLVVDDNVDAARSQAMMLSLMGHEVFTAHDGLEAVEAAANCTPDLILLDIGMPNLNGYEACKRIRELPGMREVCIAALTGWGQPDDKRRAEEAGFTLHMVKPIELDALDALLSSLGPPAH